MLGSKLIEACVSRAASASTTRSPWRASSAAIEPTCRWRAPRRPDGRERPGAVERGGVEIETVARAGLRGAAHDEGERGRARVARDEREIDAVAEQRGGERLAIGVGGKAGDEGGLAAEPRQADGDIVGRAAEHGVVAAVLAPASGMRSISASPEIRIMASPAESLFHTRFSLDWGRGCGGCSPRLAARIRVEPSSTRETRHQGAQGQGAGLRHAGFTIVSLAGFETIAPDSICPTRNHQ